MSHLLVIGGGPAGLRAAEIASANGVQVTLCDQKRSVGRKFLVAGKGGLNLTHSEEIETFTGRYSGTDQPNGFWSKVLERFDNQDIRAWADGLGVETFTQKSGRVYPKALKAAPLLRRWLQRLKEAGVVFCMNHRLISLSTNEAVFDTPDGLRSIDFDAVVLALGGASWPQTGSDGEWVEILEKVGVKVSPLEPANCGWEVDWPLGLVSQVEGSPLKNVVASAEAQQAPGEIMLTKYGLEGGPLYQLGPALRKMSRPAITLDLKPSFTVPQLARKMESVRKNFLAESQYRWKLSDAMRLILESFHGPFESAEELAHHAKSCEISLTGPRPIEEAISSAGGVKWSGLGDDLMLRALPRVFVAGEMIDWEAPTGGYLLQGCFATGTLAGESAMRYLQGFTR